MADIQVETVSIVKPLRVKVVKCSFDRPTPEIIKFKAYSAVAVDRSNTTE